MSTALALSDTTTAGGFLLVLAIMLPAAGILLALAFGARHVGLIILVSLPASFAIAAATFGAVWKGGGRWSTSSAAGRRRSALRCGPTAWRRP